ncbi:DeoR/GlpR family DNA-binding transcription regulator [Lancefieldella sp. Marseille-Q7238]|uniref:DeoR/GlpR family DNA-binding transcription regulator n=1 Tax=Lancefieldella sp. Marseille-Q7238 TaxID=3022127 RepID=UPI0024A83A24|nr:DeoR/GlpR family DNA-binding transcription regulator [Lancefieldella sp. Marseille-Q7238]
MRKSDAEVTSRRERIASILENIGRISITELSLQLDVSPLTIRRDLDYLEEEGIASRHHGYATLKNPYGRPSGSKQIRANRAISYEAAKHVKDGDCILLNTSSVALSILSWITAQDVTVITNNGKALLLNDNPPYTIILTGGEIRPPRSSMTGEVAMSCIEKVSATKCFLGCTGISVNYGLTSATSPEPSINTLMMEHSQKRYIVADSTKIGVTSNFQFGSIDEVDCLITDTGAPLKELDDFRESGVKKIITVDSSLVLK